MVKKEMKPYRYRICYQCGRKWNVSCLARGNALYRCPLHGTRKSAAHDGANIVDGKEKMDMHILYGQLGGMSRCQNTDISF